MKYGEIEKTAGGSGITVGLKLKEEIVEERWEEIIGGPGPSRE